MALELPSTGWAWMRAAAVAVALVAGLAWLALPRGGASYEKMYYAAVESDLKNLATLQEIYFREHGTYTDDPQALRFSPSVGTQLQLRGATNGWSAWATNRGLPEGEGCGMYHGATGPHEGWTTRPSREGQIACSAGR